MFLPTASAAKEQPLDIARFLPTDTVGEIPSFPHPLRHPLAATAWMIRMLFGLLSLWLLLAVIAAVPVLNLLALGYLLEAEGRLGRTGKLRFAFPLLDLAPRLGSIALGVWFWLLPLRLLSNAAGDARLIDPTSSSTLGLELATRIAAVLVAVHLGLALARGGSLGCFFRPLKNALWLVRRFHRRDYWERAERGVGAFIGGLRVRHHLWLGLRGWLGAAIWLFPPTVLFAVLKRTEQGGQIALTLLGGWLLVLVLCLVPFLQAHFATQNRLKAMFDVVGVGRLFARAPLAWLLAVVVVYGLSLPLYLLKIVLPPRDAMWLVTIFFIGSIYPAKVLTGWAYHRAVAKGPARTFNGRFVLKRVALPLACLALLLPLVGTYVFVLFFTQFVGEHGKGVLFEHHALLLPVPF